MALPAVLQENASPARPQPVCFLKPDLLCGLIYFQRVMSRLGSGYLVRMYNARSAGEPQSKGFDVRHTFIKGPVVLSVSNGLIEQIGVIIEDGVLPVHV